MLIADKWTQYRLLDAGDGEKVEYWNGYILRRPDPQVIWPWTKPPRVREDVQPLSQEQKRRRAVGIQKAHPRELDRLIREP